jgi:4-amino-4-deoxy-L-arabinose transferase-like glycosyltransferase
MKSTRIFLLILVIIGLFLRTYRQDRLLGFYFDQGRDAKVIWDFWHKGDLFLVGPTTGIEGLLLGPFYYFYIAPFYLIGNGNPVFPAAWLALTNVIAILLFYHLAKSYLNPTTAMIAAVVMTFSLSLIQDHRWLSNPTPLPLFSGLTLWMLLKIISQTSQKIHWPLMGLFVGLSLQLEAASAIFFTPAIIISMVLFRKTTNCSRIKVALALIAFIITLVPQIIFDFKFNHILSKNLFNFIFTHQSFQTSLVDQVLPRLEFYFQSFSSKFAVDNKVFFLLIGLTLAASLVKFSIPKSLSKPVSIFVIWLITPLAILLFYHGNNGYIWGYYFTGVYPVFVILVSYILAQACNKSFLGKTITLAFILVFLHHNLPRVYHYLIAGTDGPQHITLGSSQDAVEWAFVDSQGQPFNFDVYVPPVISHSYDYLFLWLGTTKYHQLPESKLVGRLYTLFEQDPPHPERLEAWLNRQRGIGLIEAEARFGGVSSQRRYRILGSQ